MIDTFNISFLFNYNDYVFYRFHTPQFEYVLTFYKKNYSYDLLPFKQFLEFFKRGDFDV